MGKWLSGLRRCEFSTVSRVSEVRILPFPPNAVMRYSNVYRHKIGLNSGAGLLARACTTTRSDALLDSDINTTFPAIST